MMLERMDAVANLRTHITQVSSLPKTLKQLLLNIRGWSPSFEFQGGSQASQKLRIQPVGFGALEFGPGKVMGTTGLMTLTANPAL